MLSGCIAPWVDSKKEIIVLGSPLCTQNCTIGSVTVHMNSGTSVEAEIDQDVKDVLKIPVVP